MHRLLRVAAILAVTAAASSSQIGGWAAENGGTTGGAGGSVVYASTGTEIHAALCSRKAADTPIIIYVQGTITINGTSKVTGSSCSTADGVIELKGVSNVSIIGYGTGALFDQIGIHIRGSSNIILQNLHIRNVKKSNGATSNGGDAIGMESTVSNVWVDHCTLEASGGESDGYDGLCDMKSGTKYVTVSYCIYMNSGRGGLVGSSDTDDDNGPVTYHHNYYHNMDSRMPLLRFATAHSYNNYYHIINESAMNPRIGGKIKAENNYFKEATNPIGTFYTDDMGYWDVSGNIFDACKWGDDYHPAGPNPVSTVTLSVPYTYTLDAASCVPAIVLASAGAYKGLQVSDGSCGSTTSTTTASTPKPATATPAPTPKPTSAPATTPAPTPKPTSAPTTTPAPTPKPTSAPTTTPAPTPKPTSAPTTASTPTPVASPPAPVSVTPKPTSAPTTTPVPTQKSTPAPTPKPSTSTPSPSSSSATTSTDNLSLLASCSVDGSSKASGSSYGNVRDGDLSTFWSPDGTTGYVQLKWSSARKVSVVTITEASGYAGRIQQWRLVDATDKVLASGWGIYGTVSFTEVSLATLRLDILSASNVPAVAEFATYGSPSSCSSVVSQWGGCLDNPGCCAAGTRCYEANAWYAQCRPDCAVSGWSCKVLG